MFVFLLMPERCPSVFLIMFHVYIIDCKVVEYTGKPSNHPLLTACETAGPRSAATQGSSGSGVIAQEVPKLLHSGLLGRKIIQHQGWCNDEVFPLNSRPGSPVLQELQCSYL
jgi:hypothetical protein